MRKLLATALVLSCSPLWCAGQTNTQTQQTPAAQENAVQPAATGATITPATTTETAAQKAKARKAAKLRRAKLLAAKKAVAAKKTQQAKNDGEIVIEYDASKEKPATGKKGSASGVMTMSVDDDSKTAAQPETGTTVVDTDSAAPETDMSVNEPPASQQKQPPSKKKTTGKKGARKASDSSDENNEEEAPVRKQSKGYLTGY